MMLAESFSGVRGTYKEDLDEFTAKKYAYAFSKFLMRSMGKPLVIIGRDTRRSSESLKDAMIEVLLQECDVIDIGINTTPAIEFAVRHFNAAGGIIITASHNPPEDNGWKFLNSTGSLLKPGDMQEVIDIFKKISHLEKKRFKGLLEEEDISGKYADFILETVGEQGINRIKESKLKIVVDPNGGTAAVVIRHVLERLDVNIIEINMELGKFVRKIEPNAETLKDVAEKVKETNADLGAGFDCDADRVELIDNKGNILSGHCVLALLVEEVLSDYKGKNRVIVTNDATSNIVKEIAEKHSAKVEEVEVGEINVVEKIDELNSPVGGEGSSSGGIFPPSRCRDGILTMLMILRLIARKNKKLSEIYEELPKYYTPRKNIQCSPENSKKIRALIEKKFKDKGYEIKKTGDETGGLKIITDKNSWIWFRASKTEPGTYRIISDSNDEERSKELLDDGIKIFNECGEILRP